MSSEWQGWVAPRCPNCGGGLWQYEDYRADGKHTWKQCVMCGAIMDHYVSWAGSGTGTELPGSCDAHYVGEG